jgi:hypothetical protein
MNTIEQVVSAFASTDSNLSTIEEQLTSQSWSEHPASGGWSPLQNIEHLNLITSEFLNRFTAASSQLAPANGRTQKMELIGRLLTRALSSKGRALKMKSPPRFVPQGSTSPAVVTSNFHQNQQKLIDFVNQSANKSLDKVKIISPFDERFKYSIFSALNILSAEQNRHFRQIERSIAQ